MKHAVKSTCTNCQKQDCKEVMALNTLVDDFAAEMKRRLIEKFNQGYRGWDNEDELDAMMDRFIRCVREARWVDAANMSAMFWNFMQED